jgi:hypothetical protein
MGIGRSLGLQGGRLVSAASTSPDDRLPELLLRRGRITVAQFVEARRLVTPNRRFETVLVEQGLLGAADLMKAVVEHTQDIIYKAFDWTEGRYRLTPAEDKRPEGVALKMRASDVILEGIRRIESWARVCRGIGGLEARYVRAADYESLAAEMTLSLEKLSLLTDLNEEDDVQTICASSSLAGFDVCRSLWAFRVIGLVHRVDVPARSVTAADAGIDDDGLGLALASRVVPEAPPAVDLEIPSVELQLEPEPESESEPDTKRVLVVGIPRELFERMKPLLSRASLVVDRVPRAESALALCAQRRFDLVIARSSFPDMSIDDFLAALGRPESKCSRAQVFLVADDVQVGESLTALIERGQTVLPLQEPARVLEEIAMRLLGAEPRQAQRLMVRVELQLDQGKRLVMCQTENISSVGMLLRSDQPFPIGTRLVFDFLPPGDRVPIRGEAEVVRHSVPDIEDVHGVGVKLLEFKADGRTRWEGFLAKRLS